MEKPLLDAHIARILGAARAQRFDEAAREIDVALQNGASGPVFDALSGAVLLRCGRFADAIVHLTQAHQTNPADMTVRINLVEALWRGGRAGDALALCDEASARADRSLRLAALGGHLAQEAGEFALAEVLYRLVLAANPSDWSCWNNLGNTLTALGEAAGALEALGHAVRLAPDAAPIRFNYAQALIDNGRGDEGEQALRALIRDFPGTAPAHHRLFGVLRDSGRIEEAMVEAREAVRLAPEDADAQADLAQFIALVGDFAEAEAPFRAALAIDPAREGAWEGLAAVLERLNREDELDDLRAAAAARGVSASSLAFIDALRFKRAHQYADALTALDRVSDAVVDTPQHQHLRGVLLDRLGRAAEAAKAFATMNAIWAEHPFDPRGRARRYRERVAEATSLLTSAYVAGSSAPARPDRPAPIFLLGFPRSGTTLLDTMLMAEPRVRVMEEQPFIAEIETELGGAAALPGLSDEQIAEARARYFERADALAEIAPDQRAEALLVDKHPMHLVHVPTIRRLFPESRFVLALRHPCDVLLSCWLTNFRLNEAMANFLDLTDAAELYDLAFAQWEKARELFELPVGTVVYERLVEATEAELRPLFDWLGLRWPEQGLDHTEAARARGVVTTASYAQVTEPIYKRAAGRWRRYADVLAPVIPVLAPWIDHFGYGGDAIPPRPTTHPL